MSENEKRAEEEAAFASSKVSELCRLFGLGYMALSYSVVISNNPIPLKIIESYGFLLLGLAVSGALVVLLDFIQYFFSYIQANAAAENEEGDYQPEPEWCSTKIRNVAYFLKQIVCFIGGIVLVLFTYNAFELALAGS